VSAISATAVFSSLLIGIRKNSLPGDNFNSFILLEDDKVYCRITGENVEPILVVRCGFSDFGNMQKALEDKGIIPITAELEWIPTVTVPVNDEQAADISKLIEKLEQDEDVQKVFHNMG
jgi:transcriptional/translational regulatory protein YebC/TACO1